VAGAAGPARCRRLALGHHDRCGRCRGHLVHPARGAGKPPLAGSERQGGGG
jgi:hypothetical protein